MTHQLIETQWGDTITTKLQPTVLLSSAATHKHTSRPDYLLLCKKEAVSNEVT